MKKRILSVALAVTMAAGLFTGCGPSKKETEERDYITVEGLKESFKTNLQINTTDKIELVVWESLLGPDQFIQEAGEWFTQLYPNITIKYINVESSEANSKIVLDGPAGNGPALFACAHATIGKMAAQAAIEPVPESEIENVKASVTAEALQGATLNDSKGNSVLYGYPVSVETYALFYNKEMISEAEIPKTMADMVAYIKEFKADSNNKGKEAFLMDSDNAYYTVMFTSTPDNHLYGPNGNDITATYQNTEAAVAQITNDFLPLSEAIGMKSGDMDYKNNDSLFSNKKLAMNISGAWNIKVYEEDGVDFGITSIPSLTGSENPPTNFMGVRCMFVSAYSNHKNEAEAFAEFLLTKEMQKLRCEITSTMPSRDDVYADIEDPKVKEYMEGLQKQIAHSYPMPNMPEASLYWSAFEAAMGNIWNGNTTDIQGELDKANKSSLPPQK